MKSPVKTKQKKKGVKSTKNDYIPTIVTLAAVSAALLVVENLLEERSKNKRREMYLQKIFDFDEIEMESMDIREASAQASPKVVKPVKRRSSSAYYTARSSPVCPSGPT